MSNYQTEGRHARRYMETASKRGLKRSRDAGRISGGSGKRERGAEDKGVGT